MAAKRIKNTERKKTDIDECDACPAVCCKDLAVFIHRPRTRSEIDDIKWQVRFDTVDIYIRHHRWYMHIKGQCMYLDAADRCTIYEQRPDKCRNHNPPACEKFGNWYDEILRTPEDVDRYLRRPKRKI